METIDECLKYTFGETTANLIYQYMSQRHCFFSEIPQKIGIFSEELRNIVGLEAGKVAGSAQILEETIVALLCGKIDFEYRRSGPFSFADWLQRLRKIHDDRKSQLTLTLLPTLEQGGGETS